MHDVFWFWRLSLRPNVMTDVLCCSVARGRGVVRWLLSLMCSVLVLVLLYLMNLLLWFL